MMNKRIYILGLDGATWDLLIPLIEKGWMPNLKKVIQEGLFGVLESTTPPVSAPAWVSFFTGVNPGKHGIYDFFYVKEGGEKIPVDSTHVSAPAIWEILSENKIKSGIVNLPITYPPSKLDGFLISGFMIPYSVEDYTYPDHLKNEIIKKFGDYSTDPYTKAIQSAEFLKKIIHWVKLRERINLYLIKKYSPQVFINVYQATDVIGHFFWNCIKEDNPQYSVERYKKYEKLLEECFRAIDSTIGNRLSLLNDDDLLIIISDHGFQDAVYKFNLIASLKKKGYLKTKKDLRFFDPIEILKKLDFLRIRDKLFSRWMRKKIKAEVEKSVVGEIDFEKSSAFPGALSSQAIFVNKKKNYEETKNKLIKDLENFRNPENNEKIMRNVYPKESLFTGPFMEELPDILFDLNKNYKLVFNFTSNKIVVSASPDEGGGHHSPYGIYVFFGKHVRTKGKYENKKIYDIIPTLLYYLNLPIPDYMDGEPITKIFNMDYKPSYIKKELKAIKTSKGAYSEKEKKEVIERLRNLGYVE